MKEKKRILGIDYGTKRVGVAVSDLAREFALPLTVVANAHDLLAEIIKIATDNEVGEIVLGESRDFKGKPNPIFQDVEKFKKQLEVNNYVVYWELEFMTSIQAERLQGKHDKIDASAAALILQAYLDRERNEN